MNPYAAIWYGRQPQGRNKESKLYSLFYRSQLITKSVPYAVCVSERKKRIGTNFQKQNFKIERV